MLLDSKFYHKQQIRDDELKKKAKKKLEIFNSFSHFEKDAAQYAVNMTLYLSCY